MNYEESIKYIKRNSYTAYEIHKATGLNEAGLRKVLRGQVSKPQRKTKDAIINFVKQSRDSNIITDEITLNQINLDQHDLLEDIVRRGVITDRLIEIIINNHETMLKSNNYKNWFEAQSFKKALEVMNK